MSLIVVRCRSLLFVVDPRCFVSCVAVCCWLVLLARCLSLDVCCSLCFFLLLCVVRRCSSLFVVVCWCSMLIVRVCCCVSLCGVAGCVLIVGCRCAVCC